MKYDKKQYYNNISIKDLIGLFSISILNGIANIQFGIIIPTLMSTLIALYNKSDGISSAIVRIYKFLNISFSSLNLFIAILFCWFLTRLLRFISKKIYISINANLFYKINAMTSSFINQVPLRTSLKYKPGYIQGQIFNLDKNMGMLLHTVFEHLLGEIIMCIMSIIKLLLNNVMFGVILLIWAIVHIIIVVTASRYYVKPYIKKQVHTNSQRSGFYIEMCNIFLLNKFFKLSNILNNKVNKDYNTPYLEAGRNFHSINASLTFGVGLFSWFFVGIGGLGYLFSLVIKKQVPFATFSGLWFTTIWLMAFITHTADHISQLVQALHTINTGLEFMEKNVSELPKSTDIILKDNIKSIKCSNIMLKYTIIDKSTYNDDDHDSCSASCQRDNNMINEDKKDKEMEINVYENLNINIEERDSVVIIGPSGCGKTSLFNVIIGLLNVNKGNVYINNININDINKDKILDHIVYITQTNTLLDDTIEYNIKLGNMDISDEKIDEIIKLLKLPHKKTSIGYEGAKLSGGQKQRVCIARALVKYKPGDLILADEIISNIDARSAHIIIKYLVDLAHKNNSIIFFIDHTQITVPYVKKVIFFEPNDNNISHVTCDTHTNLIESNINYKEYFNIK